MIALLILLIRLFKRRDAIQDMPYKDPGHINCRCVINFTDTELVIPPDAAMKAIEHSQRKIRESYALVYHYTQPDAHPLLRYGLDQNMIEWRPDVSGN